MAVNIYKISQQQRQSADSREAATLFLDVFNPCSPSCHGSSVGKLHPFWPLIKINISERNSEDQRS